jgi:hypothetical protein
MNLLSRYILTCLFVLTSVQAYSQQWAFELWHDGKIVLESGDTLRGQLKYDLQQDLVQYKRSQQSAEVFTARKVIFFEIFDNTVHKYRQFFSLPYSNSGSYKASVFFELLEEGAITLLCREVLEYRNFNNPYTIGSFTRLVLVNKYFLLKNTGDIIDFDGKRTTLLGMMGRKSETVEKFVKSNRLKYDEKYDLSSIVAYYNSL